MKTAALLHNNASTAELALALIEKLKKQNKKIVFAESCTAGLLSDSLACIPGASSVLWGSYITYTLEAKNKMLNIDPAALQENGAVSRETAMSMANNAVKQSGADIAVAVTGLAGPSGDGSSVKVGTVWIGLATTNTKRAECFLFEGDRSAVRGAAVNAALQTALDFL